MHYKAQASRLIGNKTMIALLISAVLCLIGCEVGFKDYLAAEGIIIKISKCLAKVDNAIKPEKKYRKQILKVK